MMSEYLPYLDPALPVEQRVEDLLSRMTVEEKVGQLCQLDGRDELEKNYKTIQPGSLLQILNSDAAEAIRLAGETRLKIPVLLAVDAIHGHSFQPGSTIFPTQLGISCSWDKEAIEKMGAITACEMRYSGVAWTFAPVLCMARDLRWGRIDETFGEDPYLIGEFASAMIHGLQGDDLSDQEKVMACAKHYVGYCETEGGRDASESDLSHRKLRSFFLPPFELAAANGVGSFMTGYQSMDGLPTTVNAWALRKVLRDEFKFDGILVTDWANVRRLVTEQKVCANAAEAAKRAVECGNDLIMAVPEFFQGCLDALSSGMLDIKYVDEAVRRVLKVKFKLGLFEDPRMPDAEKNAARLGTAEHRAEALKAARESVVLLDNDGILPFKDMTGKKIFVVGRNAGDYQTQCGDWCLGTGQANVPHVHPRECIITAVDALEKAFPGQIVYRPNGEGRFFDADLIVAVVGDCKDYWGEYASTATLELQDGQREMLQKVAESGKPFVLVLLSSKPQIIPETVRRLASAVIVQFSPGMLGGEALADVLTGKFNPCGRLTISIPRHVGQLPVYYNQIRGQHGDRYADLTQSPAYAFGEGKGYSEIEYVSASLNGEVFNRSDVLEATVTLRNNGKYDAVEVVQGYISDCVTSATWADMELKCYVRAEIPAGETREVKISIPVSACSIVDAEERRVVEDGEFELRIGKSSRNFPFVLKFSVR